MTQPNTVVIHHQDGDCRFTICRVELTLADRELDLEIETDENPDCPLGFLPPPLLVVESADIGAANLGELEDARLEVARGWEGDDATTERNVFRVYIGQHEALDDNRLSLRRLDERTIAIHWTAESEDFNYYDERAKRTKLEVFATYPLS